MAIDHVFAGIPVTAEAAELVERGLAPRRDGDGRRACTATTELRDADGNTIVFAGPSAQADRRGPQRSTRPSCAH